MLINDDSVEIGVQIRKRVKSQRAFGISKKSWAHVQDPKSPNDPESVISTRLNSPMWSK
jgi:hypothetical protein